MLLPLPPSRDARMSFAPPSPSRGTGRFRGLLVVLAFVIPHGTTTVTRGDDARPTRFASLLEQRTRSTFDAVADYVKSNPDAPDVERAYRWLFEASRLYGWEGDALPFVTSFGTRDSTDAGLKSLARQVTSLGLARTGKADAALDAFDEAVAGVSFRSPTEAVDLAIALATAVQTAESGESARNVYDRLTRRFGLNPGVRTLADNRLGKLDLLGKEAPQIGVTDLEEKSFSWADFRGRWVLVDFWATNCPPCLEEFPSLKQLHAEYNGKGLDVVGISLDEDRETLTAFQEKWKLPWRLALSRSDRDATRERFRVVTIPSLFLVDPEGTIRYVDVRGEELRRLVERKLTRSP